MKKLIGLMLTVCMVTLASAQSNNFENSRRVSTRGTAEREVTPDILYLSISLREYLPDGNSKKKDFHRDLGKTALYGRNR